MDNAGAFFVSLFIILAPCAVFAWIAEKMPQNWWDKIFPPIPDEFDDDKGH